ncbi:hydroxymethylglutaryl-CoA synthase [Iamia sp. SCSIO 61187]|uniref:OB-fold domain-containing protein n=1 Tax=Iamia sp. SCSIO 61187 TaxID=2722752 RepID=UPI001C62ADCA|nr:OB-fold domain-containing protein [Iamia sp. SCSIO 61187]QYG94089.1 hydroxymethylglutaryl-CoA synthase [Iamia sp. SCSIO 61187]
MRGILAFGGHLPHRRLDRSTIAAVAGGGGGKGTRTVAGYDEDATTLAVEAARGVVRSSPVVPAALWFATTTPTYADKTNATAIHAALRLPPQTMAADMVGAARSSVAALVAGLAGGGPTLVVAGDVRPGLPGSADEAAGADAGAALLVGDDTAVAPVLAELVGRAARTEEFLDRWRTPGDGRTRQWEERFGEKRYVPLGTAAFAAALADAGLTADDVTRLVIASPHARAAKAVVRGLGVAKEALADDLGATVGNPGATQPLLLLAAALEQAAPGDVVVLLSLADGADALVFRATDALAAHEPARPIADQVAAGAPLPYPTFLRWRGLLATEPPRRPEPARPSASAASRNADWKFGFVASEDRTSGGVHMPPARAAMHGGAIDDMEARPMADVAGTVVTSTVDRLAYSPSPPIVFAVVDFDGGGRLPVELTDCDADEIGIGVRVEMTFRRLFTADGIANYFWKARPLRSADGTVVRVAAEQAG